MASSHSASMTARRERQGWVTRPLLLFCLGCTAVTVAAGIVQVSNGVFSMTVREAWAAIFDPDAAFSPEAWNAFLLGGELPEMSRKSLVVWNIRLPRVLVAVIAGATLAVSGTMFQAVTRNELASPFVPGVSSGAGFAVLASLVPFGGLAPFLPLIAAVGGTVAFLLVYAIAWHGGTSLVRLVLAGVIVNMVFYGGVIFETRTITVGASRAMSSTRVVRRSVFA